MGETLTGRVFFFFSLPGRLWTEQNYQSPDVPTNCKQDNMVAQISKSNSFKNKISIYYYHNYFHFFKSQFKQVTALVWGDSVIFVIDNVKLVYFLFRLIVICTFQSS